jgi:hypothetical protein
MALLILLVSAGIVSLLGCGGSDAPPLGRVSGRVTVNGQPVEGITVMFQPDNGRPSLGTTNADGYYELRYTADLRGAVVGNHTVRVFWSEDFAAGKTPIPPQYDAQSQLKFEVKRGSNKFDIDIKL